MTSRIDALCREVRDVLNEAPHGTFTGLFANWSSESLAEWRHLPNYEAGTLATLKIVVSAHPEDALDWAGAQPDRCCTDPWNYRVFVAVLHKLRSFDENLGEFSSTDEFEACKELVEGIGRYLYDKQLSVDGIPYAVKEGTFDPFWDRMMLYENRIFKSVLNLTYG